MTESEELADVGRINVPIQTLADVFRPLSEGFTGRFDMDDKALRQRRQKLQESVESLSRRVEVADDVDDAAIEVGIDCGVFLIVVNEVVVLFFDREGKTNCRTKISAPIATKRIIIIIIKMLVCFLSLSISIGEGTSGDEDIGVDSVVGG